MNGITDKTWIVYRHTSPDGKMYVGVTCKPPNKRWQNGTGYQNNKRFSADINLYGWDNFQHEVLLSGLSEANANLAEKIFIDYWKLTNPSKDEMPKENSNASRYMIAHEYNGELINSGVITSYYDGWNCSKSFDGTIYDKAEITDVVAWCEVPEIDVEWEAGENEERQ